MGVTVAFVLLAEAHEPEPTDVVRWYREIAPEGPVLLAEVGEEGGSTTFKLGRGELLTLLMPGPVPGREAEDAARYSIASLGTDWKLARHHSHIVVTRAGEMRFADRAAFTRVVAAVAAASDALGVYWGAGRVVHPTELFVELARTDETLLMLWNGISIAGDGPGRISLLSLGMAQLGLPDMMVTASRGAANEALERLGTLLSYVAGRGAAIAEGDTIGGSPRERHEVRYEPSPIDPGVKIARIDLP
jgi:hypothetical protein